MSFVFIPSHSTMIVLLAALKPLAISKRPNESDGHFQLGHFKTMSPLVKQPLFLMWI